MGRKKAQGSNHVQEPLELKPFCYYCDREFDTPKTLIQHQRTKHLTCSECGLRFDTVTGLRVHMLNAYKKTLKEVPGAIRGRENPDVVVHGMEGVPKGIIEERTRKAVERAEKTTKPDRDDEEELATPLQALPRPELAWEKPPVACQRTSSMLLDRVMLAGLSTSTTKLLTGDSSVDSRPKMLPEHAVPLALTGLHPIALQVLAAAGVLLQRHSPSSHSLDLGREMGTDMLQSLQCGWSTTPQGRLPPVPAQPYSLPVLAPSLDAAEHLDKRPRLRT